MCQCSYWEWDNSVFWKDFPLEGARKITFNKISSARKTAFNKISSVTEE